MKNNLLALLFGCIIAFLIAEIILRIHPPNVMADNLWGKYDPEVGWTTMATPNGKVTNGCLTITDIHINSMGFRDKEWNLPSYDIAVLGDSYMEGKHVPNGQVVPHILERLLDVSVMNAGHEGYGTLHEYLAFKKYVAKYRPKTVVLFMYPFNDIQDNSHALAKNYKLVWPQASIMPNGSIQVHYPNPPKTKDSAFRVAVKDHIKTALLMWRGWEFMLDNREWVSNNYLSGVYLPQTHTWHEAWALTEHYLVTLQNDVVKNGGMLMVVPIPEYIQISRTWENDLKTHYNLDQLPDGFSRERIMNTLGPMLQRHGIPTVDLAQFFRDYRDRFSLPAPYFYYACDGHWNPLGHFLAANLVAKELTLRGLFKGDMLRIERNLNAHPVAILSPEGHRQVYTGGRFTGQTNVRELAHGGGL